MTLFRVLFTLFALALATAGAGWLVAYLFGADWSFRVTFWVSFALWATFALIGGVQRLWQRRA